MPGIDEVPATTIQVSQPDSYNNYSMDKQGYGGNKFKSIQYKEVMDIEMAPD